MQLNWKIWFWDGSDFLTVTNLESKISDLPILPVVIIANIRRDHNGVRHCLEMKRNYYDYMPEDDEWWASTLSGHLNYIDFHRGNAATLRGGMVANSIFEKAYTLAKNDPEILKVTQQEFERDWEESSD